MFFNELFVLSLYILFIKCPSILSLELPTLMKQLSGVIPMPLIWYGVSYPLATVIFKYFLPFSSNTSKSNNPKTDGSTLEIILSLTFLCNKSILFFNPIILPSSSIPI